MTIEVLLDHWDVDATTTKGLMKVDTRVMEYLIDNLNLEVNRMIEAPLTGTSIQGPLMV